MTAFVAKASRRITRRLLWFGIISLLTAARAGSNDADELGLVADVSTSMASVESTPSSPNEQQSYGLPKQNHTGGGETPADLQVIMCPSGLECSKLGGECIDCNFNTSCVYGQEVLVWCSAKPQINCISNASNNATSNAQFQVSMVCRYCYQVQPWEQTCQPFDRQRQCKREKERYKTNCTAKSNVVCLGLRTFPKYLACNWTAGYKWTTALVLSITLGGFGADRFYLGHWQEGIGKLFSFGGLGVWTLLDVVLIAVGYLGPADGSLYIW